MSAVSLFLPLHVANFVLVFSQHSRFPFHFIHAPYRLLRSMFQDLLFLSTHPASPFVFCTFAFPSLLKYFCGFINSINYEFFVMQYEFRFLNFAHLHLFWYMCVLFHQFVHFCCITMSYTGYFTSIPPFIANRHGKLLCANSCNFGFVQ